MRTYYEVTVYYDGTTMVAKSKIYKNRKSALKYYEELKAWGYDVVMKEFDVQ